MAIDKEDFKKNYIIPAAIIIGSIIISMGAYKGLTFKPRMAVKECMKTDKSYSRMDAEIICKRKIYYYNILN